MILGRTWDVEAGMQQEAYKLTLSNHSWARGGGCDTPPPKGGFAVFIIPLPHPCGTLIAPLHSYLNIEHERFLSLNPGHDWRECDYGKAFHGNTLKIIENKDDKKSFGGVKTNK